jgi:acyl-CoA reductase-like NAD-dependent aldehyde dehydrogenase
MQKVLGYIHLGQEEGAATLLDGRRPVDSHPGNFIGPTIFDGVREHMRLAQEEIFGPVLSVMTFDGEADLLRIANGTIYGLAAALWCKDITTVHRVARRLQAGTVWVNCFQHGDITVPFGGYKQSGIGREKSLQAFDKYTQVKTTWINLG